MRINFENRKAAQQIVDDFDYTVAKILADGEVVIGEFNKTLEVIPEDHPDRAFLTKYCEKGITTETTNMHTKVRHEELVKEQAELVLQRKRKLKLEADLTWMGL